MPIFRGGILLTKEKSCIATPRKKLTKKASAYNLPSQYAYGAYIEYIILTNKAKRGA
jgi:hypothetical protein